MSAITDRAGDTFAVTATIDPLTGGRTVWVDDHELDPAEARRLALQLVVAADAATSTLVALAGAGQ